MIANRWIVNSHAVMPLLHKPIKSNQKLPERPIPDMGCVCKCICPIKMDKYCWWKKSCTNWYGESTIIYRVLCISGGWPWDFWTIQQYGLEFQQILRIVSRNPTDSMAAPFGIVFPHLKRKHRSFVPWQGRDARFPIFSGGTQEARFQVPVMKKQIYIYISQQEASLVFSDRLFLLGEI